jgi:D-3-phosphoglycerate dehydrogenase
MTKQILISAPYFQPVLDTYMPFFEKHSLTVLVPEVNERLEELELIPLVAEISGAICGDDRFTKKVLNEAKKLKVISKWGTGIDSIDVTYAKQIGVHVFNTPNAFTDPVADTVLGYILSFARQLHQMDKDVKNKIWKKRNLLSLYECTLGVVGVGNIGKAIIERAHSFRIKILACDIVSPNQQFLQKYDVQMVSKEQLLSESNFITLNCDLNTSTNHFLSDSEFELMQNKPFIINAARGPLIDETALCNALSSGKISGAALDVFEYEPLPSTSMLRQFDQVVLAPHNANSSQISWGKVHENTLNNLLIGLGIHNDN